MEITTSYWTRSDVRKIVNKNRTRFPVFEPKLLSPLMPGYHVWDSWFVMNENGTVAQFNGHRVLIALVRPLGSSDGEKIGVFVETPEGYLARGFLFKKPIYDDIREWSGSTILRDDGRLQSFYTISMGVEFDGVWQTNQRFATAIQEVAYDELGLPVFAAPSTHVLLCEPDGVFYETAEQAARREAQLPTVHRVDVGSDQTDNFCFRDPKFFKDPTSGDCYLIFEGNTGPQSPAPGGTISKKFFGSDDVEGYAPTADDLKANGCVGVFKLSTSEYTFGTFHRPWLVTNLVTDEIERINLMVIDDAYYLFVAGHGNKNSMLSEIPFLSNLDYMLGFRAESLFGSLTPLNGSGVVVHQKSLGDRYTGQEQNLQYTYSWLLVPTEDPNVFDCVSYANYSNVDGKVSPVKTAGPTLKVVVKGSHTIIVDRVYDIVPADFQDFPIQANGLSYTPGKLMPTVPTTVLMADSKTYAA